MRSAIFEDVNSYLEYKIITQSMKNILTKFFANVLSCYLIIAHLSDPLQAKIHEKQQNLVKSKWQQKSSFPPLGDWWSFSMSKLIY